MTAAYKVLSVNHTAHNNENHICTSQWNKQVKIFEKYMYAKYRYLKVLFKNMQCLL